MLAKNLMQLCVNVTHKDVTEYILPKFLFDLLLQNAISNIDVDERWYLETYADVRESVEKRLVKSGKDHFVKYGYIEHRLPRPIEVDETFYLETNPDVAAAIKKGVFKDARTHFETSGVKEGRDPHRDFSFFEV